MYLNSQNVARFKCASFNNETTCFHLPLFSRFIFAFLFLMMEWDRQEGMGERRGDMQQRTTGRNWTRVAAQKNLIEEVVWDVMKTLFPLPSHHLLRVYVSSSDWSRRLSSVTTLFNRPIVFCSATFFYNTFNLTFADCSYVKGEARCFSVFILVKCCK